MEKNYEYRESAREPPIFINEYEIGFTHDQEMIGAGYVLREELHKPVFGLTYEEI